jgi:hypothetical protein
MAKTGCFPPSELRCINQTHYKNLSIQLSKSGLINTELGKLELQECQKQIGEYNREQGDYKQCLIENNNPTFEPSGKIILPLLKTIFCPSFYGSNASYNPEADLCRCPTGYFVSGEQCVSGDQLCRMNHGSDFYSKNGTCIRHWPAATSGFLPKQILTSSPKPTFISEYIPEQNYNLDSKYDDYEPLPFKSPEIQPQQIQRTNFISNLFKSIVSGFKNMFKIF